MSTCKEGSYLHQSIGRCRCQHGAGQGNGRGVPDNIPAYELGCPGAVKKQPAAPIGKIDPGGIQAPDDLRGEHRHLDDELCKSFEKGTALVSKRIESLHWLQDNGCRTFGMLCPILPQEDYDAYVEHAVKAIRIDRCEHVWAEVINLRGDSFIDTCAALEKGGFVEELKRLSSVCGPGSGMAWEQYARDAFEALARHIAPDKLRYLQYPKIAHAEYWVKQESRGALLLSGAFV